MNRQAERGFSMVEMLVATAIFTLVTAGVLTLVSSTHRSYAKEQSKLDVVWQGRAAADLMVRDLRMAGYPAKNTYVSSAGLTPTNSNLVATTFVAANPNNVVFDADLDGNGIVERVEYRLNGDTLERSAVSRNDDGSAAPAQYETMATNVNNGAMPLFTYTTDTLSTLAPPGNVNSVRVTLLLRTARPDPQNLQHQTYRFDGLAYRVNPDR